MADILTEGGHSVTMLTNNKLGKPRFESPNITTFEYALPEDFIPCDHPKVVEKMHDASVFTLMEILSNYSRDITNGLMKSNLLETIKKKNYDLLIVDHVEISGIVMTGVLDIPTILYAIEGTYTDLITGPVGHPVPWSFVPNTLTKFSDKMTFIERLLNAATHLANALAIYPIKGELKRLNEEYNLNIPIDHQRVDLVMSNSHIALEYPRPLMPNHVYIGGYTLEPPKPLPKNINGILADSQFDDIIIVSFGSLVKDLVNPEKYEVLAEAFARLPYTVLWKHNEKPPTNLGKNTHLIKWLPQKDLLGYSKTRQFVTHCGRSSYLETIYHGVPVVALPLSFDQPKNANLLSNHLQMGLTLDINTLVADELEQAILNVLSDPKYTENARKASDLFKDNPVSPRETLLYWVNYVIKHDGADHLKSQGMKNLSWYQYFLLDIIGLVLLTLVILAIVCFYLYRFMIRCFKSWLKIKQD
ncbi:unnamed protein product [Owenia fusiformis]|uniref:UDP-glucuronosyltransferase n=1 Tax=Owenia fusiformis TaxID=6347 RepID=A0A8S4Q590_OWEFU|nr:unnamed protein product [Owenia fusiformis]